MVTATQPISDPSESRDTVIYDGHCKFCRRQIARLEWLDRAQRLSFLSLHAPGVAERFPDLSHEQLMAEMAVVTQAGQRHLGASALRYLTRRLPTLWWIAPLLHIPGTRSLWSWLYRQVAKRRYLFGRAESCEDGTCSIHFKDS